MDIWTEQRRTFEHDLRKLKAYLEDPEATQREEAMDDGAKIKHCLEIILGWMLSCAIKYDPCRRSCD